MKIRNIFENFILIAIVLVIIQTLIFELSYYQQWSVYTRNILIITGFIFDLIFTAEFITRTIISRNENGFLSYWKFERGWVDFLSSIPLLILDSGPAVFFLLFMNQHEAASIGVLMVLKVVKAIRVTRILRLVRIIKIFGKIHNAESKMAQHHTSAISTTVVFSIVCILIVFSVATNGSGTKKIIDRKEYYTSMLGFFDTINTDDQAADEERVSSFVSHDNKIIRLYRNDRIVRSNIKDDVFKKYFEMEDYIIIKKDIWTIYVTVADIHSDTALNHIETFFIIVFTVLAIMIFYTKHFAQTVSDLMHILNKGFRKKDYNFQIKIRKEYKDQEIYRLASFYNDAYLPSKLKKLESEKNNKSSSLSMNDFLNFKK